MINYSDSTHVTIIDKKVNAETMFEQEETNLVFALAFIDSAAGVAVSGEGYLDIKAVR